MLNGRLISESNQDLNSPLKNSDGLSILENFKGEFTELRFWHVNLPENIVSKTFKIPISSAYELRKKGGVISRKRETMKAPRLGGGLKAPARRTTLAAPKSRK